MSTSKLSLDNEAQLIQRHIGSETGMRLRSRKAADYDDPATRRFAEMGNGGAENVEGSGQVQIPHLVPGCVVCLFHLRPSGETSEHMHQDI
jgi:hypothetical protein